MQITNVRTHSPRAGGGNDNALPEHNIESSLVVCFDPESGQIAELSLCPLRANSGHNAVQQISTGLDSIFAVLG